MTAEVAAPASRVRTLAELDVVFETIAMYGPLQSAEFAYSRMFRLFSGSRRMVAVFASCEEATRWLRQGWKRREVTSTQRGESEAA
jgi:hypothetical protein